jgi:hypothetical protein
VLQAKSQDPLVCDIPVVIVSALDPAGEPVISKGFRVTKAGGMSMEDLATCIRVVGQTLSPEGKLDRVRKEKPGG